MTPAAATSAGIRGLEWRLAGELRANPGNWRAHPRRQLKILESVIRDEQIGWAGALLWNERTGRLIDGHGRLKIAQPDERVPVLIGDWSEEAERKILLTLDPLGAMATANEAKLREVLEATQLPAGWAAELEEFLATLPTAEEESADGDDEQDGSERSPRDEVPTEHKIVVTCRDEEHQRELLERFNAEGLVTKAIVT